MDLGTILGLSLAALAIVYSIVAGGGTFASFIDLPALACVFGGSLAAVLICFPLKSVMALPRVLLKSVFNQVPDTDKDLALLVNLAETARREGLLALESRLDELDNPFIRLGVQLAVDGARPEMIEELMLEEMDAVALRHKEGKSVIDMVGKYCPAFGMIGTLLGLIMMLGQMSDPTAIGGGMAVALLTTLYGTVAANAIFLPVSDKLAFFNRAEQRQMELIIKGIMAIQSGEHPRIVEQRLVLFLSPTQRAAKFRNAA